MSKPTSAPLRLPRGGGTPSGWQALDLKRNSEKHIVLIHRVLATSVL